MSGPTSLFPDANEAVAPCALRACRPRPRSCCSLRADSARQF
ncbi:hypothetical protein HMPREF1980_01826 [Actinomyces sp. oral taxon 172 str. F0311]|nr:hypothetical protein HMPREF1980_01826 [Actinomyces sp. oral taxon 172 str. F0311]